MTYLLGWKTRSNVYMAADSVTTINAPIPVDEHSSFGERQICDGAVSVAERALKLVVDGDLAIGLCGDFSRARELAGFVFRSYRRSRDLDAALRDLKASYGPFPMKRVVQAVIAWRREPCPRLFSFNHDGYGALREFGEGEGVPLGSVRALHKGMTRELFKRLFAVEGQGTAAYLAAALGVLQSFGIHDYLLNDGVGGSFAGLCVTRDAITWQPDLLYLIDEPGKNIWDGMATSVRDRSLIVASTMTNQVRVFMTSAEAELDLATWAERWGEFAERYIKDRCFDFVVLLGSKHRVVVVLEMRRATESKWLKFHDESAVTERLSWFELHSEMVDALRREFATEPQLGEQEFRFGFEPYEAPKLRGSDAAGRPVEGSGGE